ncbi:MAG: hypothetical protein RLZZ341_818 [Pseudomonadota bacterium]
MGRSPNLPGSPAPPWATQAVGAALSRHEPLAALLQRVRDSRARLACIQPLLPPGLRDAVEAGPLDETSWVLLVRHGGAGAKLRQCEALRQQGLAPPQIRLHVLPTSGRR